MRVYHFINEKYGLDDIRSRHLKVATINELNDPFDIFPVVASNKNIRLAFKHLKKILTDQLGLLCFSSDWHNPVQWSHYADKQMGLCLGFDFPDEDLSKIVYSRKLLNFDTEKILTDKNIALEASKKLLSTKYSDWRYESELRAFINLQSLVPKNGKYFKKFDHDLKLKQVIVGLNSTLSRSALKDALGDLSSTVEVFKTRLAFKSFRVVKQRNQGLWR
jgi:hypothetical protein